MYTIITHNTYYQYLRRLLTFCCIKITPLWLKLVSVKKYFLFVFLVNKDDTLYKRSFINIIIMKTFHPLHYTNLITQIKEAYNFSDLAKHGQNTNNKRMQSHWTALFFANHVQIQLFYCPIARQHDIAMFPFRIFGHRLDIIETAHTDSGLHYSHTGPLSFLLTAAVYVGQTYSQTVQ